MKSQGLNSPAADLPALPKDFYLKNTLEVAQSLIGKGLVVGRRSQRLLVEIVEVEAYLGDLDAASHAFRGETRRNRSMFAEGGTCYVYLSYGINFCMNVVTREAGRGEAVLLRAAIPLEGTEVMRRNRGAHFKDSHLLSGPGKLTQALGIDLDYDGRSLLAADFKLVDLGRRYGKDLIGTSPRIGISRAAENPWRFFLKDSPWISRARLAAGTKRQGR